MRLTCIAAARPNFMKVAPILHAAKKYPGIQCSLVHTGQHYDERMSDLFFRELELPRPDVHLGVGSGSHAAQTARVMLAFDEVLDQQPADMVLVVGDVNSTLACALVAAKRGIPVAHVEAGLRSGDRSMPEEINRIVTDSISELLFVSDPEGLIHLTREGHPREKIHFVGNIMIDTLIRELPYAEASGILDTLGLNAGSYVYITLHRPSNVDDPAVLSRLMDVFLEMSHEETLVFAVHPRTRARMVDAGFDMASSERFKFIEPLGYRDNLMMIRSAKAMLTDSGGIQEEASALNIPCLTLRNNTERPVTVELGSSELVGNDPARIREAWGRFKSGTWKHATAIPLWDGKTGERIVRGLRQAWG